MFNGKLTYRIDHVRKTTVRDTVLLGEEWLRKLNDTTYVEILIRDAKLISKYSTNFGELTLMQYQDAKEAYLIDIRDFKGKIDFCLIPGDLHTIKSIEKTNQYKDILDISCRKYIYIADGNRFVAWIPKNPSFVKQNHYAKFFDHYFFPHGIAFEKEGQLESTGETYNILKLIKIENFKPTDEDFDKFLEDAKKQPKYIPFPVIKN